MAVVVVVSHRDHQNSNNCRLSYITKLKLPVAEFQVFLCGAPPPAFPEIYHTRSLHVLLTTAVCVTRKEDEFLMSSVAAERWIY